MDSSDAFANFSFKPPRPQGHFRAFTRNRSKYKYMSGPGTRDKLMRSESSSSVASITGSTQNLLDPAKVMSMQDDARSRKISTEVMKNRLYESVVVSPRKRRFSMRMDYSAADPTDMQSYARMVQSLPVTPAHSQNVTPAHSPTASRKFLFGYFSRGTTPHCITPEEEDEMECDEEGENSCAGLAGLLKPAPRFIPATARPADSAPDHGDLSMDCDMEGAVGGLMGPPQTTGFTLMSVPKSKRSK